MYFPNPNAVCSCKIDPFLFKSQNPPLKVDKSAASTTHKFWTAAGYNKTGSKTEHCSPDPRGGARFVQGSTAGYMGIYDFAGIENTLSLLTKPALPTSIGASYTIIEGESDITARVMLKGKGKRADGGVQTKMNDGTDKVTFEDIDGLEWIAAADGEVRISQPPRFASLITALYGVESENTDHTPSDPFQILHTNGPKD